MEMDGLDDVYKYNRFSPSDEEAVAYYLPRLIAGSALHGAEKLIHHADIYSCEPRDLAYQYAPAPQAVSSGDRFFFTTCKRKNMSRARSARVAGAGTWIVNKTKNVYDHAGAKVGEVKNLSFKKDGASTGWVMEEYRCLLPEAAVADGEVVLCRIHLSPSAPAATREQSAAYKLRLEPAEPAPVPEGPDTVTVTSSAHVQKRPASVGADDLSSTKKMRMADPVPPVEEEYQDCPDYWFGPPAPVSAAAEAEDNANLCCTLEELLGIQEEENEEQAENNVEQVGASSAEPNSGWEAGDLEEMQRLLDDGDDEEERQDKEAEEEFMARLERCNAAAVGLHSRSRDGCNQFLSFGTVN